MRSFRLALMTSCLTIPAFAQVPAIDTSATASAFAATNLAPASQITPTTIDTGTQNSTASVPRRMPPPIDPIAPNKTLTAKEKAGVDVAKKWINKFKTPHLDADGVVHFAGASGQVAVVTAVNHVTDIALAPGEIISPPLHIGDADSWKFHPAMSGSGRKTIAHILVKPIDAGLSTNVVVETNKRTISVSLTSRRDDYMPLVSLDLPEDTEAEWATNAMSLVAGQTGGVASPCDQAPTVPPDQFEITGDNVSWRPIQAYIVSTDVGMKTCVDFPSSIGSEDLPALLALADDGTWFSSPTKKIVNVRYLKRRYIADEQLTRFILVDGVGGDQKAVTIRRKHM